MFLVERLSDNFMCALKFVEPNNEAEQEAVLKEVGLMQLCGDNDMILRSYESFDFKDRLWIFLELMDQGALT